MQRLHEDDPVGHLLAQEPWEVLSFPAIAEADEVHQIETIWGKMKAGGLTFNSPDTKPFQEALRKSGFYALALQKPVLMLFEDAHWADATSLEVLDLTVRCDLARGARSDGRARPRLAGISALHASSWSSKAARVSRRWCAALSASGG
jgi:hypothetical protein